MTPTPIRQVLSTFQESGVRTLLMGGQACVLYGAAQVSKDIDFLVLAEPENFARLQAALAELQAERIAVPPFDPAALARMDCVHGLLAWEAIDEAATLTRGLTKPGCTCGSWG